MPLPLLPPPRLPLVKAERKSLPLPLQLPLVALVVMALAETSARSTSHSPTTSAQLASAVISAKLSLAIVLKLFANTSEFGMDLKKHEPALTTFKRDWYHTPKGWAKKEFKPRDCRKSFYVLRALYNQILLLMVFQLSQLSNANGLQSSTLGVPAKAIRACS
jgi:hypothetical protein